MKKTITLLLLFLGIGLYAQKQVNNTYLEKTKANTKYDFIRTLNGFETYSNERSIIQSSNKNLLKPMVKDGVKSSLVQIGSAEHSWSMAVSGARTFLWADPNLGIVTFSHRSEVETATHAEYDYSLDGGTNWDVNNLIYDPPDPPIPPQATVAAARYPQSVIYNPVGNTTPANSYLHYFTMTHDGTNAVLTSLGGPAWGVDQMGEPINPTYNFHSSTPGLQDLYYPFGFSLGQNNTTWSVFDNMNTLGSENTATIYKGTFNTTSSDFEYDTTIFHMPITGPDASITAFEHWPNDIKIRVAPAGPNEDIAFMSSVTNDDTSYCHDTEPLWPVTYKSEDAGITWDRINPRIHEILTLKFGLITDTYIMDSFFVDPVPADSVMYYREEVLYKTVVQNTLDLLVDKDGNPHIFTVVGTKLDESGFYVGPYVAKLVHIYSTNQGKSWSAQIIDAPREYEGVYEDPGGSTFTEHNRCKMTTNWDHDVIFFSWIDADSSTGMELTAPDIFVRGLDLNTGMLTPRPSDNSAYNVTAPLDPSNAHLGHASYYTLTNTSPYEIPYVYQNTDPQNCMNPIDYFYVKGFTISDTEFNHPRDNDVGIVDIVEIPGGCGLGNENISVTLKNFTNTAITSVDLMIILNDRDTTFETASVNIPANGTAPYSFTSSIDLSEEREHIIRVMTDPYDMNDYASNITTYTFNYITPAKPTLSTISVQGTPLYIVSDVTNPIYEYQWYEWDGSSATAIPGATDTILAPTATGDYFLHVSSTHCENFSDTISFTYSAFTDGTITNISSPEEGCIQIEPEILSVTIKNVGNQEIPSGVSVTYSVDGGTAISENTGEVIPVAGSIDFSFDANPITFAQEGDYLIEVSIDGDDNPDNDTYSDTIHKDPKPATPSVIIAGNGTTLISSSTSGNQWYSALGPEPGATSQQYTPSGIYYNPYYVIVTNTFGCPSDTSNFVHISINEHNLDQAVNIYPNPANDILTISIQDIDFNKVEIYSIIGEQVMAFDNTNNELRINIEELPEGAYFVRIHTNKGLANKKFNIIR